MALLVGFDDTTVAEVASRVHAHGVGSKLPKKWLQGHSDGGWVLGVSPMDGKVSYLVSLSSFFLTVHSEARDGC